MPTREEWEELFDKLTTRQTMGETVWVMNRGGGDSPQFWHKYSPKQNRRWFFDYVKRKGWIDEG